jgi:ribosome-binding protein aMBF1 (putative translation factor)
MITNQKQYRVTKAALGRFEQSVQHLKAQPLNGLHRRLRQAQIEAAQSEVEVLRGQLDDYEKTRSGEQAPAVELEVLKEVPRALVQARIAAGLTQKELAQRLGLKEQQVQRYEASGYASASLRRLQEVADAIQS